MQTNRYILQMSDLHIRSAAQQETHQRVIVKVNDLVTLVWIEFMVMDIWLKHTSYFLNHKRPLVANPDVRKR